MQRSGWAEDARPDGLQKMGGETMIGMNSNSELSITKRALTHEQSLNEQLRERVLELEAENKTLILKLQAIYAGRPDDN